MFYLLGIICGFLSPLQTCVNTKLAKKSGSSFYATLITFIEATVILFVYLLISEKTMHLGLDKLSGESFWIYLGGACGVVFLTIITMLNSRLGVVQTVVLPVLGQIIMGLLIDNYGWFRGEVISLSLSRVIGAVAVFGGIVLITVNKQSDGESKKYSVKTLLLQLLGIFAGAVGAVQTAINGTVGNLLGSPVKATALSFSSGLVLLIIICIICLILSKGNVNVKTETSKWWMWTGGLFGLIYVYACIYLAGLIGTAFTLILMLLGSTVGGVIIDQTGLFEIQKKKITVRKLIGIIIMIIGVSVIRFF